MFNGVLKSKFYTKCKSAIKLTKTRLDMIRKKRNAMQKFFKNDIADLLKNGLDINAYDRAEGLLIELNFSSCYDFIEQICVCISNNLAVMNKQRECPEECREAVASLIFAAARFSDLPELREVRSIFNERYGNSVERYVNKEFVQKLKSMPPTKDMKLQLMRDIALDSSIEWNSKVLEQKLYNPSASEQDWSKHTNDDKYKLHESGNGSVWKTGNQDAGYKKGNMRENTASRRSEEDVSSHGRKEVNNAEYTLHSNRTSAIPERDKSPIKDIQVASVERNGQQNYRNSSSVSEEKLDDNEPFYYKSIPPPYTKPRVSRRETNLDVCPRDSNGKGMEAMEANGKVNCDNNNRRDDSMVEVKPKPRSVRRRPLKPPPGHDDVTGAKDDGKGKMNSSGMRQEGAKQGLKISREDDHDQRDEEERMMDRLLIHYSSKPSPREPGKGESGVKLPPYQQGTVDTGKSTDHRSKLDSLPNRVASLAPESSSSQAEAKTGPARASSFPPEALSQQGHVHPKLPDYDDFVARLAALRGGK